MFWADRIAGEVVAKFGGPRPIYIRDEKTLSGRVHVGSLRGVAIHAALHEALDNAKAPNIFKFELNDMDPMDGFPEYLPEEFRQYMGKPLRDIPSPDGKALNFAEYFGDDFRQAVEKGGWTPEYYRTSELYLTGKMDNVIRTALEKAADIRRIYKEVSGGVRDESWLPLSVICPQCGKVSTTRATNFDGETVEVECRDLEWTKGCHFKGRVSPFGGKAKLPWKVEWPAKWVVLGVMLEGAGKDHSTRGGSRDVASHIARDVYDYEPPFDAPYEFFLVGGKKMSSSKGRGSSAKEISDLLPTKMLRLALIGKDISQQINFDPEGDTIPVLYDQYDKLAEGYKTVKDDDYAKMFEYIHPDRKVPELGVPPRFSQVAFVVQMPHMDIYKEFPNADRAELDERAMYAKRWLDQYAPEKFVFKLHDELPEAAKNLSAEQKQALKAVHDLIAAHSSMPTGEEIQAELHKTKQFAAAYLAFFGKESGPKAGWFISSLDKGFVLKRLEEATK